MRSRKARSLLAIAAALAGFEVLVHTVEFPHISDLLAFTAFVAIAELFEINRPRGTRSSLGMAPAFAYVLLGNPPLEGALVFAGGVLVALSARIIARRPPAFVDTALGALIVTGGGLIYRAVASVDPLPPIGPRLAPTGILMALVFINLTDTLGRSWLCAQRERTPLFAVLRAGAVPLGILHVTAVSLAGLLALEYPAQGLLSIVVLLGPIVVTHYAFGRLESAQRLYVQTVGALSQVPELAGYSAPGHAQRVANLAIAVAREIGAGATDLEQIEYAALLHEIGVLAMPDPSEEGSGTSLAEVAEAGAAVASETRHFPRVAEMIRHQHLPYRRRGMERSRDVPLGARIIKAVCAYDSLRSNETHPRDAWEALEHLYLSLTYDYDPAVVEALVRVLERMGEPETGLVYDATRQRDVERMKEDFFSTVSHELRTPLTPIRGWAALLLHHGDRLPEANRREALESIVSGTEHLGRLIDDLLLASKITLEGERGLVRGIEPQRTDTAEVVRRAVQPFRVGHPGRLFDTEAGEPIIALTDPGLLGQALRNILANAVKFSEDGTPITTFVERCGDRVAIRVRDHGRGIPADKWGVIFEKFTRLEDVQRMETSGAGLGLYIARQLVTAMNGSVTVESEVGSGSTFTVWLPLARAQSAEAS